mgnify:CR=1 FL=1
MKQDFDELIKYIRNLNDYTLPNYNDLPRIPLYMEQVTTYIAETLMPLFENNASTIITPYMVNNYVKAKIVIPPKEKKYDTNHIGYLIFISLLKTSASMKNLAALIEVDNKIFKSDKIDLYSLFKEIHDDEFKKVLTSVNRKLDVFLDKYNSSEEDDKVKEDKFNLNIANLALKLYVSSEINKLLADSLMSGITKEMLPKKATQNDDVEKKIENIKIKKETDQLKVR